MAQNWYLNAITALNSGAGTQSSARNLDGILEDYPTAKVTLASNNLSSTRCSVVKTYRTF